MLAVMNRAVAVADPYALSAVECRRLLGTRDVGHLALTMGALPYVVVVPYSSSADRITIDLSKAPLLAKAAGDAVVGFEVGTLDPRVGRGWSVMVRGLARADADGVVTIGTDLISGRAFAS
jgi:hypothetical protein